ncbi:MAG: LLM class flavin-dependent oxidoreductase [Mycolicibacterium sp.]|nr:LLM class flavin-dependent oxidoreductase [Mycolicibacterium sp.]
MISRIQNENSLRFGVLLNMGSGVAATPQGVFDLTLRQSATAEELGYADLWVTEHHFIDFGINPSALTTAGFLLGRTQRIRVGTAVVLSPLRHPVELAERAALLDQLSGGRFDLGLGRGGYRRDFDILEVDFARWDDEPLASAQRLLHLWAGAPGAINIQPPPHTQPHPPLLLATSSTAGVEFAARNQLALQHYFATPVPQRLAVEAAYREFQGETPAHLHTLIVIVDGTAGRRDQLAAALRRSFRAGEHPHVPQAVNRHIGPDGRPADSAAMAEQVAANAIIGSPAQVVDELGAFIDNTGARRIAIYPEAIADAAVTLTSLEDFAELVAPQLTERDPMPR